MVTRGCLPFVNETGYKEIYVAVHVNLTITLVAKEIDTVTYSLHGTTLVCKHQLHPMR